MAAIVITEVTEVTEVTADTAVIVGTGVMAAIGEDQDTPGITTIITAPGSQ